jgi:hypothetical protein
MKVIHLFERRVHSELMTQTKSPYLKYESYSILIIYLVLGYTIIITTITEESLQIHRFAGMR